MVVIGGRHEPAATLADRRLTALLDLKTVEVELDLAALAAKSAGPCQCVLPVRPLWRLLWYGVDADAGRNGPVSAMPALAVLVGAEVDAARLRVGRHVRYEERCPVFRDRDALAERPRLDQRREAVGELLTGDEHVGPRCSDLLEAAIGTGVAAGVTTALGATLFLLARRSARAQRLSAAPWWSPAGASLTVRVKFGIAR